jgi:hypothetical protein
MAVGVGLAQERDLPPPPRDFGSIHP